MGESGTGHEEHERLEACQRRLGHRFRQSGLLLSALSHSSTRAEGGTSNERLEFLGDAILGAIVSETLYQSYPELTEGELTRMKSDIVSRRTLARLARQLDLQDCMLLGRGMAERRSLPPSVLSNVLEAIIAAVHLDGGPEAARTFVLSLLHEEIQAASTEHRPENYKSTLQHLTQRRLGCAPTYRVIQQSGPDHDKTFCVVAVIAGRHYASGTGANKKDAEQAAAEATLKQLRSELEAEPPRRAEQTGQAPQPSEDDKPQ